jgi:hypothetical protein
MNMITEGNIYFLSVLRRGNCKNFMVGIVSVLSKAIGAAILRGETVMKK